MGIIAKAQANLGSRQNGRKFVYDALSTESGLREIKNKVDNLLQATKKFPKDEGAGSLVLRQVDTLLENQPAELSYSVRARKHRTKKV